MYILYYKWHTLCNLWYFLSLLEEEKNHTQSKQSKICFNPKFGSLNIKGFLCSKYMAKDTAGQCYKTNALESLQAA